MESFEGQLHLGATADISLHEFIMRVVRNALQIVQISRIGQLVEVKKIAVAVLHLLQDKVRADEACATSN